nr:hypothetical protein [Tanacetum cinerariifolium]
MDPEEEDEDDEKSEGDSIDYQTNRRDDDVDDDGNDISEDDADDEDEEECSDSEEEEEEHLALTVPAPALCSSISTSEDSDKTESFEEDETAVKPPLSAYRVTARISVRPHIPMPFPLESKVERLLAIPTPPPSAYRVTARISVRPHIPMPFPSELEVERLLAIPAPPLSSVSSTSYLLPSFLMPLPIFTPLPPPPPITLPRTRASMVLMRSIVPSTFILAPLSWTPPIGTPPLLPIPLPTSSFPLPLLLPSTSCREGIPEIRPALTVDDSRRAKDRLIGRLRRERANPDPIRTTTATEPMKQEAISNLIAQRVTEALAEYKTQRNSVVNGDTSHTTGTGPITMCPTRECTYKDYLNYEPLNFNGTKGFIGLTRWFERIEFVSSISNCTSENQIKFASCTLIGSALTWWNSHIRAFSQEVAYAMPWKTLRQMMTMKYYPRGEIKKLEVELWNLKSDEIERYVGGLPEMIRGNVMSYEPKSMQKAIENNNVAWAYAAGSREKIPYGGTKPLCPKRNFHHDGPCGPKCTNCKRTSHIARDCRSRAANTNNNNNNNNNYKNRSATSAYQGVPNFFEFGAEGHFKNNCLKLGNRNQGNQNQAGNGNVVARAYGMDYSYDVELADGQIIRVNTVIRGCTLNFLNHPFNIDLMPVELGSFDVIIGMDWLTTYHAMIVCDEKIVRVPFGNETWIIQCDGSNNGTQLNIISCTKTQKYLLKGYLVFLVNITTKTIKDKWEEKLLEDVPIVRDFFEVFPEELPILAQVLANLNLCTVQLGILFLDKFNEIKVVKIVNELILITFPSPCYIFV